MSSLIHSTVFLKLLLCGAFIAQWGKITLVKLCNIIPHCDKDCEGKIKGLWEYLMQDLIWSGGSGTASLRRWCWRWDLNYVQELLGREAGWEWWAGVGRKNMPGRGISICKGPVAGDTVTLSGHQKEDWWAGAQGVSQRCVQTCQETQASQGHVKGFCSLSQE